MKRGYSLENSLENKTESNDTESNKQNEEAFSQQNLTPFFDITLNEQIPATEKLKITDPMLFRITKDDKSFLLLGTSHKLEITCFTDAVRNLILSCSKLILERVNMDNPIKECEDFVEGNKDHIFLPQDNFNFYTGLDAENKEAIDTVLNFLQSALTKQGKNLRDLKDNVLRGSFIGSCTQLDDDGLIVMENGLISHYKEANKQIIGLEESKDLLSQIIEFDSFFKLPVNGFKIFHLTCKENKLNNCKSYAEGHALISFFDAPALAARNRNWFPKITVEADNNDLIAVGLNHLTNPSDGLLDWFEQNGYTIEKCDQFANFSSYKAKQSSCKV